MNIPEALRYTKDHEWIQLNDGIATVGITDHAQGELGDIVFVEFPDAGETVTKDDPFGTIEAVKTVADLFAPVSGEIVEINEAIEDEPERVNSDPHGNGWLVKIKLSDTKEWEDLMSDSDYRTFLESQG
jgi:glycine cleavage system H protein